MRKGGYEVPHRTPTFNMWADYIYIRIERKFSQNEYLNPAVQFLYINNFDLIDFLFRKLKPLNMVVDCVQIDAADVPTATTAASP
jgi:hypothetical protein